jgi:hypothetical protein
MLPPVSGIASHHWQQAVTAAAASINAMSGMPNMGMMTGMPQVNQSNPVALMAFQQQLAMQQQMNYYQMLAQNQRQPGNPGAATFTGQPFVDINAQGMSLAPTGNTPLSLSTTQGMFFVENWCCRRAFFGLMKLGKVSFALWMSSNLIRSLHWCRFERKHARSSRCRSSHFCEHCRNSVSTAAPHCDCAAA